MGYHGMGYGWQAGSILLECFSYHAIGAIPQKPLQSYEHDTTAV